MRLCDRVGRAALQFNYCRGPLHRFFDDLLVAIGDTRLILQHIVCLNNLSVRRILNSVGASHCRRGITDFPGDELRPAGVSLESAKVADLPGGPPFDSLCNKLSGGNLRSCAAQPLAVAPLVICVPGTARILVLIKVDKSL